MGGAARLGGGVLSNNQQQGRREVPRAAACFRAVHCDLAGRFPTLDLPPCTLAAPSENMRHLTLLIVRAQRSGSVPWWWILGLSVVSQSCS